MPTIGKQLLHILNTTYAAKIKELADTLDVKVSNLWDVLVDPAYHLGDAWKNNTFLNDVKEPLNFASCYPTAEHLFPLITTGKVVNGNNKDEYADGKALRAEVEALIDRMKKSVQDKTDAVYRIEFAGHGFTIVIRRDGKGCQAELLESLAHSGTISGSLKYQPYTTDEVYQALRNMGSDDLDTRIEGAGALGWNGHALYLGAQRNDSDPVFPKFRVKWWAADLDADWRKRWEAEIAERYQFLADQLGLL